MRKVKASDFGSVGTLDDGDLILAVRPSAPSGQKNVVITKEDFENQFTGTGGRYVHTQGSPSSTWSIAHNLGRRPNIDFVDADGNSFNATADHVDDNNALAVFNASIAGEAICVI